MTSDLCRVSKGGGDGATAALSRGRSYHGRCRFVFDFLQNYQLFVLSVVHNFRKRSRPVLSGGILYQVEQIKPQGQVTCSNKKIVTQVYLLAQKVSVFQAADEPG